LSDCLGVELIISGSIGVCGGDGRKWDGGFGWRWELTAIVILSFVGKKDLTCDLVRCSSCD